VKIGFGTPNKRVGTDIVYAKLGDSISFGLGFTPDQKVQAPKAYVWTNVGTGSPSTFNEIAMTSVVPGDDHTHAFSVSMPVTQAGTYIATACVKYGNKVVWAGVDIVWRVSPVEVDALYVRQVPIDKANARQDSDEISTMDDMLSTEALSYTLDNLKAEGINCLWIQTPYRVDPWDGAHPADTAGSDYASTDWFSIDPELSRDTRMVPAWDTDEQHRLANLKMQALIKKAHSHDMKVVFGIAPNHVGHNYIFRDYFVAQGKVKRGDYQQMAVRQEQLNHAIAHQKDNRGRAVAMYAEYAFPWMYAAKDSDGRYNPHGASDLYETYSPDWYGYWGDTKHLNHGAHAGQKIWHTSTEQNQRVLGYIAHALLWAVVELGVDGFRVDHTYGMPIEFFTQTLPWVEFEARKMRSGFDALILFHEDHDRKQFSANVGDVVQSKWYEAILHGLAHGYVDDVWGVYNNPYFTEFSGTGNHDERRGVTFFNGDLRAYGNGVITMMFLGGPMTTLAGDEYGESRQLRFKARGGVPTLWQARNKQLPRENRELAYWLSQAGTLRKKEPALGQSGRRRLLLLDGAKTIACEKTALSSHNRPLMVFSNIHHGVESWTHCRLGETTRDWINAQLASNANAYFQVRDVYSLTPDRPLWRNPVHGHTLLNEGIVVGLAPYQVQVLELFTV